MGLVLRYPCFTFGLMKSSQELEKSVIFEKQKVAKKLQFLTFLGVVLAARVGWKHVLWSCPSLLLSVFQFSLKALSCSRYSNQLIISLLEKLPAVSFCATGLALVCPELLF